MHALIGIAKVLCLSLFAAITLGWGACGALGLTLSFTENYDKLEIFGLSLAGFALMLLFGWLTRKLFAYFFPEPSADGSGGGWEA